MIFLQSVCYKNWWLPDADTGIWGVFSQIGIFLYKLITSYSLIRMFPSLRHKSGFCSPKTALCRRVLRYALWPKLLLYLPLNQPDSFKHENFSAADRACAVCNCFVLDKNVPQPTAHFLLQQPNACTLWHNILRHSFSATFVPRTCLYAL